MKRLSIITTWAALFVFLISASAPAALAATAAPTAAAPKNNPAKLGQALEIAPPVVTTSANPGQTIKATIYLRNISSGNLIVTGQANDFVASGEDGTPKLLLKGDSNNPYSMKNWVGPLPSLTLVPREIKTMSVTINVPANAAPGGHYGVIRFTATPADLQGTGVSLSASLGALVLLTVNGKIKENLSVQQFSVSHNGSGGSVLEAAPLTFTERIKNNGNVHEAPTGQVTVTNMFGKKIGAANVNVPPHNILPASIRKFDQQFDGSIIGNKKLFGKYTAKLSLTYGTQTKQTLTDSVTFWVIPYRLIALAAILLVGAFIGLRYLIKRYNRRIISKAQNHGPTGPSDGPKPPEPPQPPQKTPDNTPEPPQSPQGPQNPEPPQNPPQNDSTPPVPEEASIAPEQSIQEPSEPAQTASAPPVPDEAYTPVQSETSPKAPEQAGRGEAHTHNGHHSHGHHGHHRGQGHGNGGGGGTKIQIQQDDGPQTPPRPPQN